jgi:hypothetical protein
MIELEEKYGLIHCFRTSQQREFLDKVKELVNIADIKSIYKNNRQKLLADTIDVSGFLIWLFENYPVSKDEYFKDRDLQKRFR